MNSNLTYCATNALTTAQRVAQPAALAKVQHRIAMQRNVFQLLQLAQHHRWHKMNRIVRHHQTTRENEHEMNNGPHFVDKNTYASQFCNVLPSSEFGLFCDIECKRMIQSKTHNANQNKSNGQTNHSRKAFRLKSNYKCIERSTIDVTTEIIDLKIFTVLIDEGNGGNESIVLLRALRCVN
jgi:hypothetical protein